MIDLQKNCLGTPSPLFLLPSMALQVSAGAGTSPHSHTAAQIVVPLSGKLQVKMPSETSFSNCDAVLIPPNVNHHIIGSGSLEVMIWFDPATVEARAISWRSRSLAFISRCQINNTYRRNEQFNWFCLIERLKINLKLPQLKHYFS